MGLLRSEISKVSALRKPIIPIAPAIALSALILMGDWCSEEITATASLKKLRELVKRDLEPTLVPHSVPGLCKRTRLAQENFFPLTGGLLMGDPFQTPFIPTLCEVAFRFRMEYK